MRALLLLPCLLCLEGFHGPAGLGGFGEGIGDPVFLEEVGEDRVTVTVRGTLADVDFSKRNPSDTGLPFTAVYRFEGALLEVLFDTAAPVAAAVMSYGMGNRSPRVKFFGFGSVSERRVVRETMYHTPHGAHLYLTTARGTGGRVGYRFDRLPE